MPKFTVLSQPGCNPCENTMRAMKHLGMPFTDINVQEDEAAAQQVRDLGYFGTPVVLVRDEAGDILDHWQDFRHAKLKEWA